MPPADVSIRLSMRTALLVLVALLALAGAPGAEAVTVVTQVQATMSFSSQGITGSGPITGTVMPTGQITGSGQITTTNGQNTGVASISLVGSVSGDHISMNTTGAQVSPPGSCTSQGHMEGDR